MTETKQIEILTLIEFGDNPPKRQVSRPNDSAGYFAGWEMISDYPNYFNIYTDGWRLLMMVSKLEGNGLIEYNNLIEIEIKNVEVASEVDDFPNKDGHKKTFAHSTN